MMSMLLVLPVAGGVGDSDPPGAELPAVDVHPSQLPWDRIDTVAVLGSGPTWDKPFFYQVFDPVLDNEADAVFLVNGGDGELIRYDIGSGRTSRIGRRSSGPGEFGRPVWLEPHGPDSLLAYDMSLGRFSVFSRSGDFGRVFRLPGDGGRGRHVAPMTRMDARVWAALSFNSSFAVKKRAFAPSALAMARGVATDYDEWTPQIIAIRSEQLAKQAADIWKFRRVR